MGSGFPIRPSRNTFGPKMQNAGEVVNPQTDVGDAQLNLLFWQAAGLGVTGGLAWALVTSAGAYAGGGEAWNPNADPTLRPAVARTGAGVFTLTYETLYPDEDVQDKALVLVGGQVTVQSTTPNILGVASVALVAGQWVVTVKLTTANTGAAVDANFLVEVR